MLEEPKGISFYSIRTGETHYGKLEPTIAAYLNSSDLGINASRGQDYGWRLSPEWVEMVRAFRRNPTQMSILTAKNGGQKPTVTQILYYMYGQQLQQYFESQEDNENPFAEKYARMIANGGIDPEDPIDDANIPAALADFLRDEDDEDDMADLIDDVITEDEPAEPTTAVDPAVEGEDKTVQTQAPVLTPEEQKAADELKAMDAENEEKKPRATRSQKKQ